MFNVIAFFVEICYYFRSTFRQAYSIGFTVGISKLDFLQQTQQPIFHGKVYIDSRVRMLKTSPLCGNIRVSYIGLYWCVSSLLAVVLDCEIHLFVCGGRLYCNMPIGKLFIFMEQDTGLTS